MRKFLAGLLSALFLLIAPLSPAVGISDVGRPEITRLFVSTEDGSKFACTGTYIFPYISDYGAWLVSAGHCSVADIAARNQSTTIRGVLNWRAVLNTHGEYKTKTADIALATVPDVRAGKHSKIWLADKTPDQGRAYIHGFPAGIEEVNLGVIAPEFANTQVSILAQIVGPDGYPELYRKNLEELLPGLRFMVVKSGHIVGGSSGSPILDDSDRLIGIVWGVIENTPRLDIQGLPAQFDGWDIVLFTPVERVHEMFKSLGVDG